jgi:hypothetical protein
MAKGDLSLADSLVGEVMFFFRAYEDAERGELTLERIYERIDSLGISTQILDFARSNPDDWYDHLHATTTSYEHLWPVQQIKLFLLSNYAALHVTLRKGLVLPVISLPSIAREVLLLEWIPYEVTNEELLALFLEHPASQTPGE